MQEFPQAKEDVLLEMDYLRKRLRGLEEDLERLDADADEGWELLNPREERAPYDGVISFTGEVENVLAHGVDLSEGGVCFEVQQDLDFTLRMMLGDDDTRRKAKLAWAQRMGDGRTRFGFEFTDEEPAK
jgi:hypothetical protein